MSGACIAAMQERTRFNSMNGYASNALAAKMPFTTIHTTITPIKLNMNAQLPAKRATASAARCPKEGFSFLFEPSVISVMVSRRISSSSENSSSVTCNSSLMIFLRSLLFAILFLLIFFIIISPHCVNFKRTATVFV